MSTIGMCPSCGRDPHFRSHHDLCMAGYATGPYVVTVKQPCANPYCDGNGYIACGATATTNAYRTPGCTVGPHKPSSRVAVATLEEVCRSCIPHVSMGDFDALCDAIMAAPGTVTLPDGTRIEVEATTDGELSTQLVDAGAGLHGVPGEREALCAAWTERFGNAAQGAGAR